MNSKVVCYTLVCFGVIGLAGCSEDPEFTAALDDQISALGIEFSVLPPVTFPVDNQVSDEKIALGKMLFWDPILSGEKDVACASCHHPDFGYTDGSGLSFGVGAAGLGPERIDGSGGRIGRVGRNSPTIINTAYNGLRRYQDLIEPETAPMFWDSRMESLEHQALGPPTSFNEMAGDAYSGSDALDSVVARIKLITEYVTLFEEAFPFDPIVSKENIGKAIATFERTIVSSNSRFDQYVEGNLEVLSDNEKEGLILFFDGTNCAHCHKGPMFSDYKLTVHGAKDNPDGNYPDMGADNLYKFRTPTLRNIELTAPYTHGGMYKTLKEALQFYNRGVSENPNVAESHLDVHVVPLNLTDAQIDDLISFLGTLTDESYDKEIPSSVPSGLNPGGNID
ncbi:MAG: c-type cytochrome [Flavobacteriales bacterium]|nr:c-type cytochrome [Flavobacteriales bacterium]